MRLALTLLSGVVGAALVLPAAWAQPPSSLAPRLSPSPPLVLVGGTVVDVSDWGGSAKDLADAVVLSC